MMLNLNIEELIIGAIFGGVSFPIIKWWALLTVPLCSFLWAWTGAGHGAIWRKGGCPIVAIGSVYIVRHHWSAWIGLIPMIIVMAQGYGIPTTQPPDPGSALGRWAFKLARRKEWLAEIITRGIIYLMLAVCFIPTWFF